MVPVCVLVVIPWGPVDFDFVKLKKTYKILAHTRWLLSIYRRQRMRTAAALEVIILSCFVIDLHFLAFVTDLVVEGTHSSRDPEKSKDKVRHIKQVSHV